MRSYINIIVVASLMICLSAGLVCSQESKEAQDKILLRTSQILFPKSTNWKDFSSTTVLSRLQIEKYAPSMRSIYLKGKHLDWMETSDCSVINRLFNEDEYKNKFHYLDINGDGIKDIVYSDDAICAEGDLTIIWFGSKNDLSQTAPLIRSVKVLKIESSGGPRITSVRRGCCGDPVSQYFIGDIIVPSKASSAFIFNRMTLPNNLKSASSRFRASKEITIRSSPVKDDKYDKDMSAFASHAVFGNIVAKYLQGAKGESVATFHDSSGVKWDLLIMDSTSRVFLFHDPYKVNVGWAIIE